MSDFAKQEEWDVNVADETKEAHSRDAQPYLEAIKKADAEAMHLRALLSQARAENDRLKAYAEAPPVVNIFIGGKAD